MIVTTLSCICTEQRTRDLWVSGMHGDGEAAFEVDFEYCGRMNNGLGSLSALDTTVVI
jgi:hypothetical protein